MIAEIKKEQKKEGRSKAKRRLVEIEAARDPKQSKLVNFGIVRYAEKKSTNRNRAIKVNVSLF